MKRIHQLGVLATAVAVVSCHREPTAAALFYHGLLQSDQVSYAAGPIGAAGSGQIGFTLIARYVNRSNAPIYIERCGGGSQPLFGVQYIGSDSVPVGSTDMVLFACAGGPAIVVDAGTVRLDTFTVSSLSSLPATMRVFYLTHKTCDYIGACDALLPDSDRVSNTFQVRAAP